MSAKSNITYGLVEDRNARTAFAQAAEEITALKRGIGKVESVLNTSGYGAASVGTVANGVTFDIREAADGLIILTLAYTVDLTDGPSYESLMTLSNGFPKTAVAAAVSYLSAPPSAGSVCCNVLPDGNVKLGIAAGTETLNCVFTATWKRR